MKITIGRDPNSSIVVNPRFDTVSSNHAEIEYPADGRFLYIDHSTNGTMINNQKILQTTAHRRGTLKMELGWIPAGLDLGIGQPGVVGSAGSDSRHQHHCQYHIGYQRNKSRMGGFNSQGCRRILRQTTQMDYSQPHCCRCQRPAGYSLLYRNH